MDFEYIVKHNEWYGEDKLNKMDKSFIAGMRWVLENVVEKAIAELKDDIECNVYEMIVSMIDSYPDDD